MKVTCRGVKNWRFRPVYLFTSKMIQDTAIVTMEDEYQRVTDGQTDRQMDTLPIRALA